jgi:antitoxin component of MazEF toxin-antitoxin module
MVKRLRKVGNSSALTLDKALMELVGLDENGKVQITVNNGAITLTPVNPRTVDPAKFEASLERIVRERREVLKRLAR